MLLHVVGTQVEIQYTAVRVHVPGAYDLYRTHFATTKSHSSALVVVLQLLSAAACFTLYTAV